MSDQTLQLIGWTLIHGTWQVSAVWAIHWGVQQSIKRAKPEARYAASCMAMLACIFAAIATAIDLFTAPPQHTLLPSGLIDLPRLPTLSETSATSLRATQNIATLLAITWIAWLIGRLVIQVQRVVLLQRWARTSTDLERIKHLPSIERLMSMLTPCMSVRFVETALVTVPATFGWLRPVVLLPIGLMTSMSPAAVEAVIAHELAHIRRRDYLVTIVQTLGESVFWFHPLCWMLSRDIRQYREECCDELAIAASGVKRRLYAETLLTFASRVSPPHEVLAASGGSVLRRIEQIVESSRPRKKSRAVLPVLLLCLTLLASLGMIGRKAAARVEDFRIAADLPAEACSTTIYRLLGADRPNDKFATAVERAVVALRANTLGDAELSRLVDDVLPGGRPDALLLASLPAHTARSLRPQPTTEWSGGGYMKWDDVARACFTSARQQTDPHRRQRLARVALLISAQENLAPGGYLNRLVVEPDFADLAALDRYQARQVLSALTLKAKETTDLSLAFESWIAGKPSSVPEALRTAVGKRAFLQWRLANYLEVTAGADPERADAIRRSVDHGPPLPIFEQLTRSR